MVVNKEPVEGVRFHEEIEKIRKLLGVEDKYKYEFSEWFTNNYITPKTTKIEVVGDQVWITTRGDKYNFILGRYDETVTQIKKEYLKNEWESTQTQVVKTSSPSRRTFEWPNEVENALQEMNLSENDIIKIIPFISKTYISRYGKPVNLEVVVSGQGNNLVKEYYLVMENGKVSLRDVVDEYYASIKPKKVQKENLNEVTKAPIAPTKKEVVIKEDESPALEVQTIQSIDINYKKLPIRLKRNLEDLKVRYKTKLEKAIENKGEISKEEAIRLFKDSIREIVLGGAMQMNVVGSFDITIKLNNKTIQFSVELRDIDIV